VDPVVVVEVGTVVSG